MSLDSARGSLSKAVGMDAPANALDEPAVLFFDTDGTLVWMDEDDMREDGAEFNDFGPSPLVQDAFKRLHEHGHLPILCTGRPLPLIPESLHALGFAGYVLGAGACIMFNNEIVYEAIIPRDTKLRAADILLRGDGAVLLESRTTPVFLSKTRETEPWFAGIPVASSVEELCEIAPDLPFSKMSSAAGGNPFNDEFRAFAAGEGHLAGFNMGLAWEFCLEGVDKGSGVKRALEYLGRDAHRTFAFGDSENDRPMFEAVETSVAMGNAMDSIKAQADFVTTHAKDDGIPVALRHFGLI